MCPKILENTFSALTFMRIREHYIMKVLQIFLVIILFGLTLQSAHGQKALADNEFIVAYYGRPHVKTMGVLGQHSVDELAQLIQDRVKEYEQAAPNYKGIPAFNVIFDMATSEPGRDGDYISSLSESQIMPYINKAQEGDFMVFIDLQLGKLSPLQAVKPVLKYLKYKNVHLAIDPEFEVLGLDVRPGKVIGHIDGNDINQVQTAILDYLKDNNIEENKLLMIHNFTSKMVRNKQRVRLHDDLQLIMNLDGHGPPHLKVDIYNGLYNKNVSGKVIGGFKLFFNEDHPMMTVKEVLGQEAVSGGMKMRAMPRYINYQ